MAEPDQLAAMAPGELRLGLPGNHYFDNLHDETGAVIALALDRLRVAGCNLIDVSLDGIEAPAEACGFPIVIYETKPEVARYLAENAPDGPSFEQLVAGIESPDVKAVFSMMLTPDYDAMAEGYRDAIENRRPKLQQIIRDGFAREQLDAILFPTIILPAVRQCLVSGELIYSRMAIASTSNNIPSRASRGTGTKHCAGRASPNICFATCVIKVSIEGS